MELGVLCSDRTTNL